MAKTQLITGKVDSWIAVEGYASTRRKLRKCLSDNAKKELNKAIRDGLQDIVLPVVRRECPVRTGALRNSLAVRSSLKEAKINAGNAKVPYAGPIHFGWPDRNIPENRFIYRALRVTVQDYIRFVTETFAEYEKRCTKDINKNARS